MHDPLSNAPTLPVEPVPALEIAAYGTRSVVDPAWRWGLLSSAAMHVGIAASMVVASLVWQWWFAGWWELIVPPPNTNAVAASPARVIEVATFHRAELVEEPAGITVEVDLSAPAIEPLTPRELELSHQGEVALPVAVRYGEDLARSSNEYRMHEAEPSRTSTADGMPRATEERPPVLPRQTAEDRVEPSLDASAASVPIQGVETTEPPRAVFSPSPVYPPALLAARIEGVVKVRVDIDPEGRVTAARVLVSSGRPEFDRAAQEAVVRWRFAPAPSGQAGPRALAVPIRFGILPE